MDFSFIIPTYNETDNIKDVIRTINKHAPGDSQFEIIVVDHGSSDDTVELARACGAKVLRHPEGTIAKLRNHGAEHSSGSILVFLDADIRLTLDWEINIEQVERTLTAGERILTGSWYSIPEHPNWLEKFWFKPLERGDSSHINSGHLIISRLLFNEINGFDEKLVTGEDYDISVRAKAAGIKLIDNVTIKVIHEGYPDNILEFLKREYWHGYGDATSFVAILQSKIAMISLLFIAFHMALLTFCFTYNETAALIMLAAIACIVVGTSSIKYRTESLLTVLINSVIYYVYFWARGLSILSLPGIRNLRKRTR